MNNTAKQTLTSLDLITDDPAVYPAYLAQREEETRQALEAARERHIELCVDYTTSGKDVGAQVLEAEREIQRLTTELERLAAACSELAIRASRAASEEARLEMAIKLKAAMNDAASLGEDAMAVVALTADLGTRLAAMKAKSEGIRMTFIKATGKHFAVEYALKVLALPNHFHRALWASGVGRLGIQVDDGLCMIRPPMGREPATEEGEIQRGLQKLDAMANAVLTNSAGA